MPNVTIHIISDDPVPVPIQGVVVFFYTTGAVFETSGTTDINGDVTVVLPINTSHDVLFFKQGVSILPKQPQRIDLLTDPAYTFQVVGHVRTMPESPDPEKCRVSGYVMDAHGRRVSRAKFTIGPCQELIVIRDDLMDVSNHVEVMSDENGYVEFDLMRGVEYEAFILYKDSFFGLPPGRFQLLAPELPAVRLVDLFFPIPVNFDFSVNTLGMGIGQVNDSVTLEVTFSDGNIRTEALPFGTWKFNLSDPTVLGLERAGNKLIITATAVGVCTITIERIIKAGTTWDPEPPFAAESLVVTVT